ncbi:hypothetical protein NDU88_005174 [Pleurodeles waltl]|uniref:Uncharacterized protein n=1 Tax=Pleurodeles waltl TaxID=8319 RepID=A0AAV7RHS2_PLEWA|nr:hypothetical protein NDU88_005174 [Pleurodeles waltl]
MVSTEVTLVRVDFCNINTRLKEAEDPLSALQTETATLRRQVRKLSATTELLGVKLEDYEGLLRRNNIRLVGIPEKAKGPATDLFVEDLI